MQFLLDAWLHRDEKWDEAVLTDFVEDAAVEEVLVGAAAALKRRVQQVRDLRPRPLDEDEENC